MAASPELRNRQSMPARLRALLSEPVCHVAPGAFSPFVVPLIEEAGFPLVYATGLGAAADIAGYPDVGLITMTEMVNHIRYIVQRATVPVIADADTGYGGATSAARTVREYEDAGVAGLHIEDQAWPKRCGHLQEKSVIPCDEMVEKIKSAIAARRDPDFVIIARTDAIAVEGFEAAVSRARQYVANGADALFFDAIRTVDQIRTVAATFDVPLVFNMSISGLTPRMLPAELGQLGYRLMLFAGGPILATHHCLRRYFEEIRETGSQDRILGEMTPLGDFMKSLRIEQYL